MESPPFVILLKLTPLIIPSTGPINNLFPFLYHSKSMSSGTVKEDSKRCETPQSINL